MEHFGQKIMPGKYGFKLNHKNYAPIINLKVQDIGIGMEHKINEYAFDNESCTIYTQEWVEYYRALALVNLDLNLEYFAKLNVDDFNEELDNFLLEHDRFEAVHDLDDYDGKSGYYLLVFDEYKQIYIGNAQNIKKRIRSHWTSVVPLERSLFPMYNFENSKISIRSFRALDNTRIYIAQDLELYVYEDYFISKISPEFMVNRIGGGIVDQDSTVRIADSAKITSSSQVELPKAPSSHHDLEMYERIRENYEKEKARKKEEFFANMKSSGRKRGEENDAGGSNQKSKWTQSLRLDINKTKNITLIIFIVVLILYFLLIK